MIAKAGVVEKGMPSTLIHEQLILHGSGF